jgi:hypothetical protein
MDGRCDLQPTSKARRAGAWRILGGRWRTVSILVVVALARKWWVEGEFRGGTGQQDLAIEGNCSMIRILGSSLALTIAAVLAGCLGEHDMGDMNMLPEVIEVPPSEGPFETTAAEDLNPDPNLVEVYLEARVAEVELAPGRRVSMWTYNGLLPGPRIEARVGNTVRIRFKNSLPEATTIPGRQSR